MTEPVERRVETLETDLRTFRTEVRDEFAKVHAHIDTTKDELRREMGTIKDRLQSEMKESFEEAKRLARVLHEETRSIIKTIREG